MSTIFEKINSGEYKNNKPYPNWRGRRQNQPKEIIQALTEYQEEEQRIYKQFKHDIEEEHGVLNHPKADVLWRLAWEHGHSCGYSEVASYWVDFVELIK
jgi:hypothetical protein